MPRRIARPSWRFPERATRPDAGKQMFTFISNSPNSFHYLKACELMGDICVTLGKFAEAQKYYAQAGPGAVARLQDSGPGRPGAVLPGAR